MATTRIFEVMGIKFNLHGLLLQRWVFHKSKIEEDNNDDDDDDDGVDDNRLTNKCPEL